ncbi:MAG TPA: lipopolysaccharide biosynthesis protein [Gaiellaceae bacterium]|jgi:O-antigen/teichoic acid export membrane protein|nr:lipopolysaccharide biosynthesis protein [Gaiellaceae bacterium]
MSSRVFRRRSATAAWIYVAVAFGIVGTIVAARVLGRDDFGVFATALVAVGFFQTLLDLTVEESLTKYGFRYVAAADWGRLRRLFRQALLLKLAGGVVATILLALLAPFADEVFDADDIEQALLAAALLPLVQASENVGATALLLHSRYDLRGVYQAGSAALRLVAIVVAAPHGVTAALGAIVVAQAVSTVAISAVGVVALRRFPAGAPAGLGEDVPEIRAFVVQSSLATGVISLRGTLVPLVLGVVSGTTQVGLFRIAQTPQTGLAAASSPARLMLMTEQTRDWEKGERAGILRGLRAYSKWAGALMLVAVPAFFVAMPWLIRVVFGAEYEGAATAARIVLAAAAIHFVIGWTKSLPVTIGRPRLRIVTHGVETLVAIPLVAVLGAEWGATGAAVAVLVSTLVFAAAWLVVVVRLRDEVHAGEVSLQP